MDAKDVRDYLCSRVEAALQEKGADPEYMKIDSLLPHELLEEAQNIDPNSVLEVAMHYGFLIPKCCSCGSVRPNGRWIPHKHETPYDNAALTYCPP
ncbi:MAG: hypothetical protein KJ574_00665, partial [Nanoarchaeota archaeon]|nr:hypothetical protein [Nanoarchaeota archaeon]